jgi:hypothetical protein
MRFRVLIPLLSALVVAACVAPPRQAPVPPAPPVPVAPPAPPPPVAADWRDRPYTPGDWRHLADPTRPAAEYRDAGGTALFALNCDRPTRTITIALSGPAAPLTIRTTSTARTLPTRVLPGPDAATPPTILATLPATDPLFDAMAFSRGRFSVEQPGRTPLVLPAWAEIGRVIDDCRV